MLMNRRFALGCACASLTGFTPRARASSSVPPTTLSPDAALARLMDGNRRFVADRPEVPPAQGARRTALAGGQGPFATVLACSDSRTPPNTIFDTGLGDTFVLRVAGNSLFPAGLGSIEFASTVLRAPLVMVLGHERCGAVQAAVQVAEGQARLSPAMTAMVQPILPAVAVAKQGNPADLLEATVRWHAILTARQLRQEETLKPLVASGALRVVAARYDLDTGSVELLDS